MDGEVGFDQRLLVNPTFRKVAAGPEGGGGGGGGKDGTTPGCPWGGNIRRRYVNRLSRRWLDLRLGAPTSRAMCI